MWERRRIYNELEEDCKKRRKKRRMDPDEIKHKQSEKHEKKNEIRK